MKTPVGTCRFDASRFQRDPEYKFTIDGINYFLGYGREDSGGTSLSHPTRSEVGHLERDGTLVYDVGGGGFMTESDCL